MRFPRCPGLSVRRPLIRRGLGDRPSPAPPEGKVRRITCRHIMRRDVRLDALSPTLRMHSRRQGSRRPLFFRVNISVMLCLLGLPWRGFRHICFPTTPSARWAGGAGKGFRATPRRSFPLDACLCARCFRPEPGGTASCHFISRPNLSGYF